MSKPTLNAIQLQAIDTSATLLEGGGSPGTLRTPGEALPIRILEQKSGTQSYIAFAPRPLRAGTWLGVALNGKKLELCVSTCDPMTRVKHMGNSFKYRITLKDFGEAA
jgi:hypothetical protein